MANLETGNFENDLQAAASETFADNDARFSSGSLSTDINGDRLNCNLHLLNTLSSVLAKPARLAKPTRPNGDSANDESNLDSDIENIDAVTGEDATDMEHRAQ